MSTAFVGTYYNKSQIVLWDVKTGAEVRRMKPACFAMKELRFSATGLLASQAQDLAHVWDPTTGRLLATLDRMNGQLHSVAFTPDGSGLALTWGDGRAGLWDAKQGRLLQVADSLGTGVT